MQPNPDNEDTVLCADLIAPEGYELLVVPNVLMI